MCTVRTRSPIHECSDPAGVCRSLRAWALLDGHTMIYIVVVVVVVVVVVGGGGGGGGARRRNKEEEQGGQGELFREHQHIYFTVVVSSS